MLSNGTVRHTGLVCGILAHFSIFGYIKGNCTELVSRVDGITVVVRKLLG